MVLRIIASPAVEPISVAEVMRWGRISSSSQEPAPGAITAALASPAVAGNVDNGAHRYLATFVTPDGETQAGAISAAVTVADKTVNGRVSLTGIPLGGSLVTARKLYRTQAAGSVYMLLATLADNTTVIYTDNIADASLGAGAPSLNTTSDPMLAMMITAARRRAEALTGRALITQTWERVLDAFPCGKLEIGMLPLQSITSVKYYDEEGDLQTMDPADYVLDADTLPGWVYPAYEAVWPSTRCIPQAVIVRFIAGYGATGASVPEEIKQWIAIRVAQAFEQPGAVITGTIIAEMPRAYVDGLLDPYRIRMSV